MNGWDAVVAYITVQGLVQLARVYAADRAGKRRAAAAKAKEAAKYPGGES